jgi:DNA-binding transcriptional LysR family regulator
MELKHLVSFIAVAEQLSFVRAARQIHLSQPALSGQIQRLEEELGVRLLMRNRRSVKLTDAGRVFLTEARLTLAAAAQSAARSGGCASRLSPRPRSRLYRRWCWPFAHGIRAFGWN